MSELIRKILVVDDEAIIVEEVSECLDMMGYKCLRATSGQQAMDILEAEPDIELIITDVRMPDITGEELVGRYRTMPGGRAEVIIVTGHGAGAMEQVNYERLNVGGVLRKPVDPADLVRVVAQLLVGGERRP